MSKLVGPQKDGTGLYYVSFTSSTGEFWQRWFHTFTAANRWLADMERMHG